MKNNIMDVLMCNKCGTLYSKKFTDRNSNCREYGCRGHLEEASVDFPKFDEYGVWEVTTEGDCEGRTTRELGIYQGNISDIAVYLKDKVGYTLRFKRFRGIKVVGEMEEPEKTVSVEVEELGYKYELKIYDGILEADLYALMLDENKVRR